jgi:outer membrane biosynthesis protein TonB
MDYLPTSHSKGVFASSLIFHGLIAFLLIQFVKCERPDPPLGSMVVEMDLMADWGNSSEGMGETESENPSANPNESPNPEESAAAPAQNTNPNVNTQTNSSVTVPKGNDNNKPVETPKTSKGAGIVKNNSQTTGGGQQSDGEKPGTGNSGVSNGLIEGKGVFGNGKGTGGWSLMGGELKKKPTSDLPTEEGKVVIDIEVDKDGNVVGASVNVAAGNTTSQSLFNLAKKAAYTAKFTARTDGSSAKRKGTLTFNYKLN